MVVFESFGDAFVVTGQAAKPSEPAECSLDNPSLREQHEASLMELIKPRSGNPIALIVQDVEGEAPSKCKLKMVELDPNGDQQWTDLRVGPEYPVGLAKIEGHGGHHSISADGDRFRCVFTNPGDGTISVLSLVNRSLEMTFPVGGHPSKVIAYGGHVH